MKNNRKVIQFVRTFVIRIKYDILFSKICSMHGNTCMEKMERLRVPSENQQFAFKLLTNEMDVLRHNNNRMYTKQRLSLNI